MELTAKELFGNDNLDFTLYIHQASAVQWMKTIEYNIGNPNFLKGGILADDMGMGKTETTCALIASTPVPSTLILCPPSVRFQWIDTCLRFIKGITIYTIDDGKFYKGVLVKNSDGILVADTVPLNSKKGEVYVEPAVLICNYQLVTNGIKNDKLVTDKIFYRYIIDEGHLLRNETLSWDKLNQIKQPIVNGPYGTQRLGSRWILSGTPVQMERNDLANIFKFIDNRFILGKTEREIEPELRSLISTNLFRRNRNQLTPYMKRFMNYPEKDPIIYDCVVTLPETSLSKSLEVMSYEMMCHQFSVNPSLVELLMKDERSYIIVKITEARFYNNNSKNGTFTESEEFRKIVSYPFGSPPMIISQLYGSRYNYSGTMSKMNKLLEIMRSRHNESFIIFHHYDGISGEIERTIQSNYPYYNISKINGKVTSDKERYNIVQRCNALIDKKSPTILISSTGATKEGINYQKFSKIIKFDPEYNQKTDEQANGRVQRIGQKNQVEIFEIIADDFMTYYGLISVDKKIQTVRDGRTHLSDIIEENNAAFYFRRYYRTNAEGQRDCGVYFGDALEKLPQGSICGPNSTGGKFIF